MKNKIITIGFLAIIYGFFLTGLFTPDKEISFSERRPLAAFPSLSVETAYNGEFMKDFDKYTTDHFPLRQGWRGAKAVCDLYVFRKQDNNRVYFAEGHILKIEYPLNSKSVENFAAKLNGLYDTHLQGMAVYYGVIPDKNYFAAEKHGYPALDYALMQGLLRDNIENMRYIDLFGVLTLDDYYRTDLHWKQENLNKVAEVLAREMDFALFEGGFTQSSHYPFYGAYYGQAALPLKPDTLVWLSNGVIENARVEHFEITCSSVYDLSKPGQIDSYDVFLSGAVPIVFITNESGPAEKELIIFRDSFAGSLAPLLLAGYGKITLVDLRYMHSSLLPDFIEFADQDVLFLLSTLIVNNSWLLK
ncbi:MAG: hypothetical protein FWE85_06365 [Clostridiales bacterium]|nr:hypothetical protein [Clostridiales bacterium]